TLLIPVALRRIVDGFSPEQAVALDSYFMSFFGVAAALALFTAARFYFVSRLGERVVADIRKAVYARVVGMSPSFYDEIRVGETLSRLTTDTTVIQSAVGSSASIALRNMLVLIGGVLMLFLTSPFLTALTLLIVPLVVGPIIVIGRRLRGLSRLSQDKIAEASGLAGETLQAAQTVQAYTYEDRARAKFDRAAETAFDAAKQRIWVRSQLTAIIIFLAFAAVVGVIWLGARSVISGEMSAGELSQFVLLAVFVAGAVAALSEVWGEVQRAAGATERLIELLEAEDPIAAPATPTPPPAPAQGRVAFENVAFHYPSRPDTPALGGVSFTVAPGETVALVGPSGAGKSTVFQLLLRFYDPAAGTVRLDGGDLAAMDPRALRERFALVPQEPAIFADTIAENIRIGRPGASDAEVAAAARAAAAHDFITAIPDGYDAFVGERGVRLSGGQRQRLAIARAILRDAPVLLLDEATSALDAESERLIQDAMANLFAARTTLVIAHRLATVKQADRILVLDGGRLVAEGRHSDLIAEGGLYARLARLQLAA
ncbi:MAG: ABC transporter transmembrane domain-containing protein, partial [Pseudomonadota bacterium]